MQNTNSETLETSRAYKDIRREDVIKQLWEAKDKENIKVLTGIRRSGKSTTLQMFAKDLLSHGVSPLNIQHYNFEKPEDNLFDSWREVYNHIIAKLQQNQINYIFIDEPHLIENYEKLLNGLFTNKNIDLYITGSNAYMLSSDLSTLLSGRYIEIHITPFSLREFQEIRHHSHLDLDTSNHQLLMKYLYGTSFPSVCSEEILDSQYVNRYLENIHQTVMQKDVFQRFRINDKRALENTTKFIYAHIGSPLSPNGIANMLKADGQTVSNKSVERYLQMLCDCFLLYRVPRFDMKGKYFLKSQEKYYIPDLGLRRLIVGQQQGSDIGHQLENIVYFELLRRGGQVWVGKAGNREIDFVVQKYSGTLEYYQVAYTAKETSTLERELGPLQSLKDSYPKYLLTTDDFEFDFNGIKQLNLANWLLG
jgi:predicted AAA+ superfamily ATPase